MNKSNNHETAPKKDGFESTYSMQIPKINNADNFRIDKIIEDYRKKINSIAKIIISDRKPAPNKNELPSKNPDILAKLKFKKENKQNLLKINDAIIDKILSTKPSANKEHHNMINRLAKGDTKLMLGIPQLKSKDGHLLNSPLRKQKLEKYKNEAIIDLMKIDDSYDDKITDKDLINNINNFNSTNKEHNEKHTTVTTRKSNFNRNNEEGFFLTGVGAQQNKKVDFLLGENPKHLYPIENILNNKNNNEHNKNNLKKVIKSKTGSSTKSIQNLNNNNYNNNLKKESTKSNFDLLKDKANLKNNNAKIHLNLQVNKEFSENEIFDKDSDLFSDENRYLSITKKGKSPVKTLQSLGSVWNTQENNCNTTLPHLTQFKGNLENLSKLKSKENDFFKMALRTKSLKNLQNQKTAKKEKKFLKTNYISAMNEFLSTVNTEMDFCTHTFTDIEKGMRSYDHIQSVHWAIQPEMLLDKKMIYQDEQFVRKYFIYGTQGGQFISEDKGNDDIIERSDNLAKITPEISFKFKKIIMERFAEKPLVDCAQFIDRNEYKQRKFKENTIKVAKLIDDTDKRKARIEKDLSRFFLKAKE
jgi:hypothetical protein